MIASEEGLLALAANQYGTFTRAQALQRGLREATIAYRIESRRWAVVHPGVYRLTGSPSTGRQRAMAAALWLGDAAAVSHTTAARLLRLDGVRSASLHLSIPNNVRRGRVSRPSFVLHRPQSLEAADRVVVDGIPCTSAARTLIDLAGVVNEEVLEVAFESARRMGLTSTEQLASRFTQVGALRKGTGNLRALLEHQRIGERALESPLEVKAWRLLRKSALPLPERQVRVGNYRVDFMWPAAKLIVECDGFDAHAGHLRWKRDRERIADIELRGYRVVHVMWDDVIRRADDTISRIQIALAERGFAISTG
jgi:very-short-patch-repair endonuclease